MLSNLETESLPLYNLPIKFSIVESVNPSVYNSPIKFSIVESVNPSVYNSPIVQVFWVCSSKTKSPRPSYS
jgi:hypothetical protein